MSKFEELDKRKTSTVEHELLEKWEKEDLLQQINNRSLKFFMNILDDYGFLNKYYISIIFTQFIYL